MGALYAPSVTPSQRKFCAAHQERRNEFFPEPPKPRRPAFEESVRRGKFRIVDADDNVRSELIIQATLHFFPSVTFDDVKSNSRLHAAGEPRWISIYLCCELTKLSYVALGRIFGGRHHTTIMHAHRGIREKVESVPEVHQKVGRIKFMLGVD